MLFSLLLQRLEWWGQLRKHVWRTTDPFHVVLETYIIQWANTIPDWVNNRAYLASHAPTGCNLVLTVCYWQTLLNYIIQTECYVISLRDLFFVVWHKYWRIFYKRKDGFLKKIGITTKLVEHNVEALQETIYLGAEKNQCGCFVSATFPTNDLFSLNPMM